MVTQHQVKFETTRKKDLQHRLKKMRLTKKQAETFYAIHKDRIYELVEF